MSPWCSTVYWSYGHELLVNSNFVARFFDRRPERLSSDQQQSTAFDGIVIICDDDEDEIYGWKISSTTWSRFTRTAENCAISPFKSAALLKLCIAVYWPWGEFRGICSMQARRATELNWQLLLRRKCWAQMEFLNIYQFQFHPMLKYVCVYWIRFVLINLRRCGKLWRWLVAAYRSC